MDHSKSNAIGSSKEDDEEAVHWHKLAAEQKFAASQYELAMFQRQGRGGLEADDAKVVEWLQPAAEQNDAYAQYEYALMIRDEKGGLERDDKQVFDLFLKSAKQDYQPAKDLLEEMGLTGVALDEE